MCGTSAGAINAVTCAYGLHVGGPAKAKELLEQLWRKVSQSGSFFQPSSFDKIYSNGDMHNSPSYMFFNNLTQYMSPYNFNPFNVHRSVGVGARMFLPMLGMLGIDYAIGLDQVPNNPAANKQRFFFVIGMPF